MTIWWSPLQFDKSLSNYKHKQNKTKKIKQSKTKNPRTCPRKSGFLVVVPHQAWFSATSNGPNDTARNKMQKYVHEAGQILVMVISWSLKD